MTAWLRVGSVALVLLWPLTASAFGPRQRRAVVSSYPSYYPTYHARPVTWMPAYGAWYYVPSVAAPVCFPSPQAVPVERGVVVPHVLAPAVPPQRLYAVPRPAPPSDGPVLSGPIRPAPRQLPRVNEDHSGSNDPEPIPYVPDEANGGRCRVGFWNVSRRDLVLNIDGQTRLLPRGRSVTLTLKRQFVWRVDERESQRERVPAHKATLEIVIRR